MGARINLYLLLEWSSCFRMHPKCPLGPIACTEKISSTRIQTQDAKRLVWLYDRQGNLTSHMPCGLSTILYIRKNLFPLKKFILNDTKIGGSVSSIFQYNLMYSKSIWVATDVSQFRAASGTTLTWPILLGPTSFQVSRVKFPRCLLSLRSFGCCTSSEMTFWVQKCATLLQNPLH